MTDAIKNLLVELFVEELPPKALKKLGEAFAAGLAAGLRAQGLVGEAAVVTPFASPRRLAAHITAVSGRAADRAVLQKLMPVAVALRSGYRSATTRSRDRAEPSCRWARSNSASCWGSVGAAPGQRRRDLL